MTTPQGKAIIQVSQRVTLVNRIEYNEQNYPGMTLAEALAYEKELPREDKLGLFAEAIQSLPDDRIRLVENITVSYQLESSAE